jgi:chromosome segregation ATPase
MNELDELRAEINANQLEIDAYKEERNKAEARLERAIANGEVHDMLASYKCLLDSATSLLSSVYSCHIQLVKMEMRLIMVNCKDYRVECIHACGR